MKKLHSLFAGLGPFLLLWSGQAVSSLGSAMTSFALIIWAYKQQGSAMSVMLLAFCTYLPSILFSFAAGALADRWNKKTIMLTADTAAALGTLAVLLLYRAGSLAVWHLYVINLLLSLMNAFQIPAATVAVSILAPPDQYTRVGGLQAFSNALVTLLTPALATALLAFGDLEAVLAVDLVSFCCAFIPLAFFIRLPRQPASERQPGFSWHSCREGFVYLRRHGVLLRMILFFAFVNLLASMAGNGVMVSALILARTGNNEVILGMVSTAIGLGSLIGSLLVTALPPPKSRVRVIFLSCGVSFLLCDLVWGLGRQPWLWIAGAVLGNLPLPFLNANLTTLMRTQVPIQMQGRVFSARDTLQYFTIPMGYLLGGFLADRVFEPLMASSAGALFAPLVGVGPGSGTALIFVLTGLIGATASFLCLRKARYRLLDD